MADVKKTIEILFTATDRATSVFDDVASGMSDLNSNLTNMTQPFADIAARIEKLTAALGAFGAVGLAYAYNESLKFQSAQIELEKVVGDNQAQILAASDNARLLGAEYGKMSSEVIESTASFKQAGFDVEEAMTLSKNAMDLVIAGGVGAAESSEILISILKGFKAPAEDAARAIDIMNEVSNNYATDVQQLGIGMAGISPIAKTMGFSMEETAGLVTPVIEVFRSGSEAAIAMKTGLLKLIDDSAPVEAALKQLGVAQKDANGQLRSGKDILYDVAKAFESANENQKLFLTKELVGIDQSARMVEVFNNLTKATEITATAMGAAGSATAEVEKRLASSEVIVQRTIVSFRELAVTIGNQFREAADGALEGATDIFDALNEAVDEGVFDEVFNYIEAFFNKIGDTMSDVAEQLPEAFEGIEFDGLINAIDDLFSGLTDLVEGFFGGLDLTTAEGIEAAVQTVVDSIETLIQLAAGIAKAWQPFIEGLGDLVRNFNDSGEESKELVGNILGLGQAINSILGITGGFVDSVQGMTSALTAMASVSAGHHLVQLLGLLTGGVISAPVIGVTLGVTAIAGGVAYAANEVLDWALGEEPDVPDANAAFQIDVGYGDGTIFDPTTGEIRDQEGKILYTIGLDKESVVDVQTRTEEVIAALYDDPEGGIGIPAYINKPDTDSLTQALDELGVLKVPVEADTEKAETDLQQFRSEWYKQDGEWIEIKVPIEVDTSAIKDAKDDIDKLPDYKLIKIEAENQTKKDIARIKAEADILKHAFELKADLDIAKIEAEAEKIEALADSVARTFEDTGQAISSLFGQLDSAENNRDRFALQRQIERENERRDKALQLQEELVRAEVELMEARSRRLDSGDALFTINGEGLEPHLEMIFMEVMQLLQNRANEEGIKLLLGI